MLRLAQRRICFVALVRARRRTDLYASSRSLWAPRICAVLRSLAARNRRPGSRCRTRTGDPHRVKMRIIEAMRLGLAYEYDPYFSLSIARVDPLPHQLEAVYEYSSVCPASASCLPTIRAPGRPSWRAC